MSNSDSPDKKENSSDPEDPHIEIPKLAGNELTKKSQLTRMDIRGLVVRCTACLHQINHLDPLKVKKHRTLGVLICIDCYEFYGTSEFSQDESGNYNYCAWCGNGGKLFICDFCPNTFCSTCVRRNIGRAAVSEMSKEGWKCYCCDPSKLRYKVGFCNLILEYSKNAQKSQDKKASTASELIKSGITNWPEAQTCLLSAFDSVDESCQSFHRRVEKLKNIGMSQSKSLKHIIAKFEEIVNSHRTELNHKIKSLSRHYLAYMEKQKKIDEKKPKSSKSNEDDDVAGVNENKPELDVNGDDTAKAEENGIEAESKSEPDDAKLNINEDNEKAKLSLLNLSESSLSEIDDILAEDPLMDDDNIESTRKETEEKTSENALKNENDPGDANEKKIDSDSDIAELFSTADKQKKKKKEDIVKRKLDFEVLFTPSSDADDSESSICLSSGGELKSKSKKKETTKSSKKSRTRKVVTKDDPKLKMEVRVKLERIDHLFPNGETTVPVPTDIILEDLDKEIMSLIKDPVRGERVRAIFCDTEKKEEIKPKEKKPTTSKKKICDSSSSIYLSSSEEEEVPKKKLFKDDPNMLAKKQLLTISSDESTFSGFSEEEEENTKKKSRKAKAQSGSSDDFQPKKKKKFDKLLHKRIFSDGDSDSVGEKNDEGVKKKKQTKRKKTGSDDSKFENKKNSDDTSSDSEEEIQKKKKKRKRIKKTAASSSDEGDKKEEKKEDGSQNTPGKGRKHINKIISKDDLAIETKEAQNLERERRRRVQERQKMYNVITDTAMDGKEIITRKMVLEVDPVSKEEIVEIHPELVEKLKPHQVNGVKFMWECTIESLKQLETEKGSGCILAHCMGLGKTLQVVAFLHTCLTNKFVNKHIKTAMVICPYNTVLNWSRELDHWLSEIDGNVLVHELTLAKDVYMKVDVLEYWQREGGVLIISYNSFRSLAGAGKIKGLKTKSRALVRDSLIDPGPDIVICDEGHALKNVKSSISKACASIKTERRVVLTGTPLQNNLLEYHCMLSFVKPHLLGTPKEFRNRFVNPIMNGQYDDSTEYDVKRMKKRIHILHKILEGCVQRCDYSALTKFLPPKHEFVISIKLSETQIKMYKWYLDNKSRSKTQEKIQGSTLFTDYNILRNLCTHPYIVKTGWDRLELRRLLKEDDQEDEEFINDESEDSSENSSNSDNEEVIRKYKTRSRQSDDECMEESFEEIKEKTWFDEFISQEDKLRIELSGKMVLLVDILKECETIGDKLILFSQSLLTFDLIEELLGHLDGMPVTQEEKSRDIRFSWKKNVDYFRMDGSTSAEFRKQYIDYFNDPAHDRARLFLVSTKAGGLGTNLVGANRVIMLDASWNPSHDVQAIFRVYRFGQKKPVYIYRFLAYGTMEEKIYDRQVTKLSLSIRVVDEQQIDRHFNAAELAELYNFEPEALPNRPTPMVPKDTLLAEMLIKHKDWIVTYHEHDSLLQNETEEDLTEEERKAAWTEFENEREGRYIADEMPMEDTIKGFCKEPDFNEAIYEGSVIPSAKSIIETIIASFRQMYPTSSAAELRKKLQGAIFTLRALFQEKHVKILRMKQEFVAKGTVPVAVNKYLEELNHIISDLTLHYDNVTGLVNKDMKLKQQAFQAQVNQMQFNKAQSAQFGNRPGFPPMVNQQVNQMQFNKAQSAQFGNRPGSPPMVNQQHFNAPLMNPFVQRFPQFNSAGMNLGGNVNFKPGDIRFNTSQQQNFSALYQRMAAQQASLVAQQKNKTTSEPVVTETEPNEATEPTTKKNSHSTVEITEIE